jgi:undecaprenyl diphosphate synthase
MVVVTVQRTSTTLTALNVWIEHEGNISQENPLVSPPQRPPDWPQHVAIIMDGNGRWARKRLLPRLEGHRQGANSVRRVVEFCRRNGIGFLTLYAFSTENWQRPRGEVTGLMKLLSQYIDSELEEIHSNDIQFRTIGDLSRIPARLREKIQLAKERTMNNQSMVLSIALSYGGRQEIVAATRKIAAAVKSEALKDEEITEDLFSRFLDTSQVPDPDLLIRTGGEMRISNFLLWQSAYTELYFTRVLWPDFDDDSFMDAVETYRSRERRFGTVSEQISVGEGGL